MNEERAQVPTRAVLEAGVRRFVEQTSADSARIGGPDPLPVEARRRVAEEVRKPWRQGGPAMARTSDHVARADGREVRIRIHEPSGGVGGVLVYMHGGGWTLFSLDTHDRLMREYAARSGLTVVGVDYSLSPESRFPTALEDVGAVLTWLGREGAAQGLDPGRIVLGGDSAGGNLALAACLRQRDEHLQPAPRGLLLNYGVFDFGSSEEAMRLYGGPDFMLTPSEMAGFWDNYLRTPADAKNPLACPLRADLAGLPPVFLAVPECDILAEQSVSLAERLGAAGVKAELRLYTGATHSFLEAVEVSPLSARALDEAAEWLRSACALA